MMLVAIKLALNTRDATADVELGPIREGAVDGVGRVLHVGDAMFRTIRVVDAFGADVTDELGFRGEAQITAELWRIGAGPVVSMKREGSRR